ncbi:MAG: type VI secretion system baseplate subunit TssK [Burkholderiales bacterium]|nr:type VI secretion system baseplate subunit TssK [Burkholderiales bacterium]
MSDSNRVAWTEGLFLRPQHFQQAERYLEKLLREAAWQMFPYGYGFARIELDQELGKLGKLGLAAASGILPDGTPFDIPRDVDIPTPLEIPDAVKDALVVLALPVHRPGSGSMGLENTPTNALARYFAADFEARDAISELDSTAELKVGRLNLSLRLQHDLSAAYTSLGVARVIEKRPDGRVILDEEYYPSVIDCRATAKLFDCVKEVHGLLRHRAQALAERISRPGTQGVAEIADFLLLQLCNRMQPVLEHLSQRVPLHPEVFYGYLVGLAGELATFARKDKRTPDFGAYRHGALWETFQPVMEQVRLGLTAILEASAIAVPLEDITQGYYVGRIQDVDLLRNAIFVLAVNAQVPAEILRARFPREAQIGSKERIRPLVESQLPGIPLRPLPVAPRQIPYHAGYTYFELDKARRPNDPVDYWKDLETSRMMVMHVAGDFPELSLQLWAIRAS